MKFSCEKNSLLDAISVCIHAVAAKNAGTVLEGLLITAGEDVTLTGFNYKTGIQMSFPALVQERGAVVLGARIISDIVRKLPDSTVEISADERMTVTVKCASSEFNLVAYDPAEFPELPQVERSMGVSLPALTLKEMINKTLFAVSENENKPIHTGSLFEVDGSDVTVISVDGYRLAVRRETIENRTGGSFRFVVPGPTLKDVVRILPDDPETVCTIYPERKHALFEFGDVLVTTRLLEGEFLNYKAAVPMDNPVRLRISRAALIEAVERVSLIISERIKNPVRCLFEGDTLKLSCITAMGRSFDECSIPSCGERIEIGFNNRYLLDALRAVSDEEFMLCLKSGLSPCVLQPVEGDRFLYMVLPVRLKAGE